jgi:hypothetical protein
MPRQKRSCNLIPLPPPFSPPPLPSHFTTLANIVNAIVSDTISHLFRRFFDLDDPATSTIWTTTTTVMGEGEEEEEIGEEGGGVVYVPFSFSVLFVFRNINIHSSVDCSYPNCVISYASQTSFSFLASHSPHIISIPSIFSTPPSFPPLSAPN